MLDQLKSTKTTKLMYNRLDANYHLSNKKALFVNIREYYIAMGIDAFEVAIPLTFHISSGQNDPEFVKFKNAFEQFSKGRGHNVWIVKPGENTNRGCGIQVASSLEEIKSLV